MAITELGKVYKEHYLFESFIEYLLKDSKGNISLEGLSGSSKSLMLSAAYSSLQTTHLVLLPEK